MIRLLILCLTITTAFAASSPDNSAKSAKASSSQLQRQEPAQKTSLHDDPMLNAINAYAHQYDATTPPAKAPRYSQQIYSQQYTPSLQLPSSPTIESNFQPMPAPHQKQPHSLTTPPVIMHYLPQSTQISDGGVQYLQLIPTRPLLVPISPYLSPVAQAYQAPQIIPNRNEIPAGSDSYGHYGDLQNFFRFNREIKPANIPEDLKLNLNEYMPSPNDAPNPATRVRGRP